MLWLRQNIFKQFESIAARSTFPVIRLCFIESFALMLFPRLQSLMRREGMTEKFRFCWFQTYSPADKQHIATQLSSRPWLPKDYLEFLNITDGAILEMFVFYGIADGHPHQIPDEDIYAEPYSTDDWFTVGNDPAGDAFVIHRSGKIATVGSDPPPDEPVPLCDSFRELIEEICCGPRYVDYFGGVPIDNEWFAHIKSKGWA